MTDKIDAKECPDCGHELQAVLFMGEILEFYACTECKTAFDAVNLQPLGRMF